MRSLPGGVCTNPLGVAVASDLDATECGSALAQRLPKNLHSGTHEAGQSPDHDNKLLTPIVSVPVKPRLRRKSRRMYVFGNWLGLYLHERRVNRLRICFWW